jgi:ABC-type uncharacterized transport system substrate-binding protein
VQGPKDFETAFAAIAQERPDALLVLQDAVMLQQRKDIVDFAIQKRLSGMFQAKGWAEAGGLMSYGEDLPYMYRRAAYFIDKIFKGAKPADLPVEQATKFELVLNLKTARTSGCPSRTPFSPSLMRSSSETPRFHHVVWRRRGGVAARGARATSAHAGARISRQRGRGRL